jgi:hypothetical protein
MNDHIKLAIHDALVAYLFESSAALDGTIKSLATGALVSTLALSDSLDSAKFLLSKVTLHPLLDFLA